jgi:predicted kinase
MIRMQEGPTLYMMVGYPGSGKTTTSRIIHGSTGAVHIWADHERGKMFARPTHSKAESRQLYDALNKRVEELLVEGKSVIFDTNFNFYKDRQLMRDIAARHHAAACLVWVRVDKQLARERATHIHHSYRNGYSVSMPTEHFDRMAANLEPPTEEEQPIILDGTKITPEYVHKNLNIVSATR